MSLRLRLLAAFFLLSVVPLFAVTLYNYTNNVRAMQDTAGREAELLAGELTQRMQVVMTQLTDRVGYFMDLRELADAAAQSSAGSGSTKAADLTADSIATQRFAQRLGEVAMVLNNVDIRGRFGGGRGRGGPPPNGQPGGGRSGGPALSQGGNGQPPTGSAPGSPNPSDAPDRFRRFREGGPPGKSNGGDASANPNATAGAGRGSGRGSTPDNGGGRPTFPQGQGPGPDRSGSPNNQFPDVSGGDDRIRIDLMPIRTEMMQQLAPPDQWATMSDADRQKIIGQVNERMLGIEQGIRLGTDAAQKKIADAQHAADAKAQEIASQAKKEMATASSANASASRGATPSAPKAPTAPKAPVPPAPVTPTAGTQPQRKTAISGGKLNVTVEQNGEVVNQLNADLDMPNLLATVFSNTRRDRGELPFAVGKDGHIYTATSDDLAKVQALGGAVTSPSTAPGTTVLADWIVVTTNDPTGTGLKFGIARPVGSSITSLRRTAARNAGFGFGLICLALVGMVPLSSRLTRNLERLSDGVTRIAHGDYKARVSVASHDEIGQLAQAFNKMAADVERHQQSAVEQERIKRELELGRQIQHDMLPQAPLRLGPTEIQGVSVPAREVGGDFFNYFQLDDGRVALLVGDVSGKGVGAALLMANIQAALRTRLAMGQGLALLADAIDRDVEANTPGPVYATLFVGMFDPKTRKFQYVNAGHHPQFVLRGGHLLRMSSTGLPVGLLAGRGYTEDAVQLQAGDLLFFYTDGCVEAQNASGDMFGAERLEALLESSTAPGTDDVLARIEKEIATFRSGYELYDDATMMAVRIG